ncbi:hypothetical protein [Nocardia sp. NPDC052316]|uniref:hypothetical protein n=1 Tax=Nocardia sp. NPDC052316 TaxID=3364329 RepID=UPI0037C9676C
MDVCSHSPGPPRITETATRAATPAAIRICSATAVAYPDTALVKYWGKRDDPLILPVTGNLSMTLDIFPTTTRVTLLPRATTDHIVLNVRPAQPHTRILVEGFLDAVRALAGRPERARVDNTNTVPTGAELASSASGFAALAAAASAAYGLLGTRGRWRGADRDLRAGLRRFRDPACRNRFRCCGR